MPNLNNLFIKHNENITLSDSKKQNLTIGRDAIRSKLRSNFKDNDRIAPKFHMQGSFAMKTAINPLPDMEYDVDDGVYLPQFRDTDQSSWPTTKSVHNWIYDALEDHTKNDLVDKSTCVRVVYAKNYHIDLPIYIIKDDLPFLAHKTKGWIESDPKAFTEWFKEKVKGNDEQMRRLIKYLKGWRDSKCINIKSIALVILVADNYYKSVDRDDKSLLGTLTLIISSLKGEFSCLKPVVPNEDLFENYTYTQHKMLIEAFEDLGNSIDEAINISEDEYTASILLIDSFDERFPKGEKGPNNRKYIKTDAPAVINNDGRSA